MSTLAHNHANLFDDDAEMNFQIKSLKEKILLLENRDRTATRKILTLEDSVMHSAENAEKQFTKLSDKWTDFSRMLESLTEEQRNAKSDEANKLLELKRQNETYRQELCLIKKERERLSELQEKHYRSLLQEPLPKSITILQSMLESYRKSLAAERASKDSLALKVRSEKLFMEEQLKAEQARRLRIESSLASELHTARGEIVLLKSAKCHMDKEIKRRTEIQKELEESTASLQALKKKSDELIQSLKEKCLAEKDSREQVELNLAETRHKLKSLHRALETSEQVQRDFVRLSQSLQVELEHVKRERSDMSVAGLQSPKESEDESEITSSRESKLDDQVLELQEALPLTKAP